MLLSRKANSHGKQITTFPLRDKVGSGGPHANGKTDLHRSRIADVAHNAGLRQEPEGTEGRCRGDVADLLLGSARRGRQLGDAALSGAEHAFSLPASRALEGS